MIDISFLRHLDRLSLIINKRITSNYVGERAANYAGRGLVFKDHSMYSPGDDFKAIDWKVFARTDKLFVKRYEEERNLVVHVIMDFSGSMAFGEKTSKSDYASMFGLGFAYMALKNNEKFVISTFSEALELFQPRKGRSQVASLLQYLNKKKPKGNSKFELSLAGYKKLVNSKSLIVIISDFLYNVEEIKHVLWRYKSHEIMLIQVLDKAEKDLKIEGDFQLEDMEDKGIIHTFISAFSRKKYKDMLESHNARIKKACTEVGAKFFSFSTDYPMFDAFYEVLGK